MEYKNFVYLNFQKGKKSKVCNKGSQCITTSYTHLNQCVSKTITITTEHHILHKEGIYCRNVLIRLHSFQLCVPK